MYAGLTFREIAEDLCTVAAATLILIAALKPEELADEATIMNTNEERFLGRLNREACRRRAAASHRRGDRIVNVADAPNRVGSPPRLRRLFLVRPEPG